MDKEEIGEWLVLFGGTLAVSVSITLLVLLVLPSGASINLLNAFTLCLGVLGGTITLIYSRRIRVLVVADLILVFAAAPTVFGAVWLLYVPPIVLVAIGIAWKIINRYFGQSVSPIDDWPDCADDRIARKNKKDGYF